MRKVRMHGYDGPSALRLDEVAEPVAGPGELLLRAEVVGLTLPVLKLLRGFGEVPLPHTPGGDLVGRVAAVGPGVTGLRVGDRVGGVAFKDVYAELVPVSAALVTPVSEQIPAADALAVVRSGLVALSALRAGGLASGESVLITAAAGGVGHLAVQLARELGAGRVVAAVGSAEKADFVRGLGADEVVCYEDADWGAPVDLVVDSVGSDVLRRTAGALVPFGRLVVNSGAGGTLDAGVLLRGMHTVIGLAMSHLSRLRPELIESHRAELWQLLAEGRLRPVSTAFPLERAAEGVELLAARANLGKVLLDPTP
ncbi:zinc-binding dehydrogenase [Kitasatospora sp. GP82]|uniref:quinone oxidoreductase family protein n=1 Tax=Kitasatospora sp. GP82 TaxID=3035089 RepID=UPI0024750C64|nr:zinc-binding dehydrogenase [Kitasatospora sp. GP82]MDH6130159.1 NADPH2:quinone reductase [Kitasatospora sp. GP82]